MVSIGVKYTTNPIANKYREGKLKSTLKRERNSAWNRSEASRWGLEGKAANSAGGPCGGRGGRLQNSALSVVCCGCWCTFAVCTPPPLGSIRRAGMWSLTALTGSWCSRPGVRTCLRPNRSCQRVPAFALGSGAPVGRVGMTSLLGSLTARWNRWGYWRGTLRIRWRVDGCPSNPSWNTDQGVQHARQSLGWFKPAGKVKASHSVTLCIGEISSPGAQAAGRAHRRPIISSRGCGGAWACTLRPERWWTMPGQDEARGNSGGGP